MKRVIIESPWGGCTWDPPGLQLVYLRACLADSLARGESPIASHGLLTQPGVLDDLDPEQRRRGMQAGWDWYAVAGLCAVYLDLGASIGMMRGIEQASAVGTDIDYRNLGGKWTEIGRQLVNGARPSWPAAGPDPYTDAELKAAAEREP